MGDLPGDQGKDHPWCFQWSSSSSHTSNQATCNYRACAMTGHLFLPRFVALEQMLPLAGRVLCWAALRCLVKAWRRDEMHSPGRISPLCEYLLKGPSPVLAILSWQAQRIQCTLTIMFAKYYIATRHRKSWNFKPNAVLPCPCGRRTPSRRVTSLSVTQDFENYSRQC